jgi:hypothetical protein
MRIKMSIDNYYWVFSASAQGIAALFGFLLAGVALAFQMMDRLVDRDATLLEVSDSLKAKYHGRMTWLAAVTGTAILGSLLSTWMNPWPGWPRSFVMTVAAMSSVVAIVWAIVFVVQVVSPKRYANQADSELLALSQLSPPSEPGDTPNRYFSEFIGLERDIRDWLKELDIYVPSRGEPRMSFSFRQMIDALYQNERIDSSLRDELLAVNKFRNLLFHGHTEKVPSGMMDQLLTVKGKWDRVKSAQQGNRA